MNTRSFESDGSPSLASVAAALKMQPNRHLSRGHVLRFGKHGSLAADLRKGSFFDFERGAGGGAVELVQLQRGCDWKAARDWLAAAGFAAYRFEPGAEQGRRRPPRRNASQELQRQPGEPAPIPEPATAEPQGTAGPDATALRLWHEGKDVQGTVAERYLRSRGLRLWRWAGDVLRFHPACPRRHAHGPALLTLARNVLTGRPQSIQRTFLAADGRKLGRMDLGPMRGAVAMLSPDEEIEAHVAICEGTEDGMALLQAGMPSVWATFGSAGMAKFPLLHPAVEALTICCDNDEAGRNAAYECWKRWREAGRTVEVLQPAGKDFAEAVDGGAA